jgi:hypothetical protein
VEPGVVRTDEVEGDGLVLGRGAADEDRVAVVVEERPGPLRGDRLPASGGSRLRPGVGFPLPRQRLQFSEPGRLGDEGLDLVEVVHFGRDLRLQLALVDPGALRFPVALEILLGGLLGSQAREQATRSPSASKESAPAGICQRLA